MTTTSLPPSLRRQAKLHRLERAKQRSTQANPSHFISSAAEDDANAFVERFYGGSWDNYAETKQRLGMTDEHAAVFERYGVILQPKQIEFAILARAARTMDGPNEIGMGGARGGAKTFAVFAVLALDDCMTYPGLVALYLRLTAKAVKEQLEDVASVIVRHIPGVEIQATRIRFPNGSRIVVGGFKDDTQALAYQGFERDRLAIEEATQLSQKTHETLNLVRRSSKIYDGVPLRPVTYYSTNPLGVGHAYFKKRFVDNERKREHGEAFDPHQRFIFATVDDNKAVNVEYVDVLDALIGIEYRAYRLGDWDVSAGAYFDQFREVLHVIANIHDLSWMREVWCSMDQGYQHWNMVYLHAMDGDGNIYTVDELARRKEHPPTIAPAIHEMLARHGLTTGDLSCFLVGSDVFAHTGAAEQSIAEKYQTLGIDLTAAEVSSGSRIAGAIHMAELLGDAEREIPPRWFITRRCERLRECLPYMERDPKQAEDVIKVNADARGRGGDDPYDAARYGLWRPHVTTMN